MFDNLLLTSMLIIVLWLVGFGFYLYTSRQQRSLQDEVESLERRLDEDADQMRDRI